MLLGANLRDPVLINSIFHTAGVLLFGLVCYLLACDGRAQRIREIKLPLAAALLALIWNAGSLVAIAAGARHSLFIEIVMTVSFAALSLLPAILLQVVLRGSHPRLIFAGYGVSGAAVLLHFAEVLFPDFEIHQPALGVVVLGFGILTIAALLVRNTGTVDKFQAERPRWISLVCLLLFTTSFLHFGYRHHTSPWAAEVTWHHIGIPVALIVLLQDYRFMLLDTFIRFLVNLGLASLYIAGLLATSQRVHLLNTIQRSSFLLGVSLIVLCLSLILFAHLRNALQRWMSRVIFRRQNVGDCEKNIVKLSADCQSEEILLGEAAREVAHHVQAKRFAVLKALSNTDGGSSVSLQSLSQDTDVSSPGEFLPEARIPLRFSSGDTRFLAFGARHGGRRYLSEDLADMRLLGTIIVEQVERFRAEELKRLVTQAELRALQAQINPHFLFNALNTLYGTIDRTSSEARRMVLNLADIFRYLLEGDRTAIPLSEELRIVEAYLEIESVRLGERLETEIQISQSARSVMIPVLSIQPLIENAVKHGISERSKGGRVSLKAERTTAGLRITVEDSGAGFSPGEARESSGTGVGLENVRRRLLLCHGSEADLHIESGSTGTIVTFFLPDRESRPDVEQKPNNAASAILA